MFCLSIKILLTVIPANPLALLENRRFDEKHQRAVVRYYLDAGVGGLAVGVHTTQFEIRKPEHNLLERVLRDRPFYKSSGGGVTVSGGEALAQPEFTLALLKALKAEDIHTALDTTGFCAQEIIDRVLPYTDLFLYDLKLMDSARHKEVIKVPNERILSNARHIAEKGGKMQIRIPLIPEVNMDEENLRATLDFCLSLGEAVTSVQLLPYHELGLSKYAHLGVTEGVFSSYTPDPKWVEEIRDMFVSAGVPTVIH